jgi:hypothetical protein
MRPGEVVSGSDPRAPSVYAVLAQSARSHSRRYLSAEGLLAGAVAMIVVAWQPRWWPVASLALAVGLYASWGLLAGGPTTPDRTPWRRFLRSFIPGLATAATVAGLGGLAVKAFSGTVPGPYGVCYRPDGTSYACRSDGNPRPVSRPHS